MEELLLAFARTVLMLGSLVFDGIFALGKIGAPVLGLAALTVWPFIALRDKKQS